MDGGILMNIELKILNKEFYQGAPGADFSNASPKGKYKNIPKYITAGSAGVDLICTEDYIINPGETVQISTGLAIHIGSGHTHKQLSDVFDVRIVGMIVPRSGLGTKGLILANTIGIIDEDYQGDVIVQAWNRLVSCTTEECDLDTCSYGGPSIRWGVEHNTIKIKEGDRFAQLIFVPIIKAHFNVVEEFRIDTERGSGGFGSSGK